MTDHAKEAIAAMEQLQADEIQVLQQARGEIFKLVDWGKDLFLNNHVGAFFSFNP